MMPPMTSAMPMQPTSVGSSPRIGTAATAVNATVVGCLLEGVEAEDMELWHAMHDPNDPEDADGEDLERHE